MNAQLEKFRLKASHYKEAIELAPNSRCLEILPIVMVLEQYANKLGIHKSELLVVDIMAGNGYLTKKLYEAGFTNIVAIEACNQMSFGSSIFEEIQLYPIPSIDVVPAILKSLNPHAVVSLASFHHLIVEEPDGVIEPMKSKKLQYDFICECYESVPNYLLMVIADLSEHDVNGLPFKETIEAKNTNMKLLKKWLPDLDLGKELSCINTLSDYVRVVENKTYSKKDSKFAVEWFRNIVNNKTTIGHLDMAISQELIDRLSSKFRVTYNLFPCPWIFESLEQLKQYIYKKFAFSLEPNQISPDEVLEIAKQQSAVFKQRDTFSFDWSLGLITIEKKKHKQKFRDSAIENINFMLVSIVIMMTFLIVAKLGFAKAYIDFGFIVQTLMGFFLGGISAHLLSHFSKK